MNKELELWQFIASRLKIGEQVMLLVVATSSGSSPGRAGYKMAVAADGELTGSIGGGVMEVGLVEQAKVKSKKQKGKVESEVVEQVHQKNSPDASGMICSGRQTVIFRRLTGDDIPTIDGAVAAIENREIVSLTITSSEISVLPTEVGTQNIAFESSETDFTYMERLGAKNELYIIGGGHCALALSELMSKLDFRVSILDDRPELNTITKNEFADRITIIDGYENVGDHIYGDENAYVVVMTLGFKSDAVVVRDLLDRNLKYFGVLGSKAKMATLMRELRDEGCDPKRLARIRTPIGLAINSRTPDEIAVSIAAEIIATKNADRDAAD